jgi:hypothetical protein
MIATRRIGGLLGSPLVAPFTPAYASLWVDANSATFAGEKDVFDENTYPPAGYAYWNVVPPERIVYTSTNGRFTVLDSGIYRVSAVISNVPNLTSWAIGRIRKNGVQVTQTGHVYTYFPNAPNQIIVQAIVAMLSGQYVNFTLDDDWGGPNVHSVCVGSSVDIYRVA